uniref:hypothetical protein n=1 Tax=Mariniflexile sp. TaxID=1979402 RepID=UPI00404739A0
MFSSVPTTVAGLDKGAGIALPIRAYTLDASETVAAEITFTAKGLSEDDLTFYTKDPGNNNQIVDVTTLAGFSIDQSTAGKVVLSADADAFALLTNLSVRSDKDFRGEGVLNVSTVFTVTDGGVQRSDPAVSSTLSIFQEVPQVEFKFSEYQYGTGQGDGAVQYELRGEAEAEIKFSLDKPLDMPDGIGLDAVTILVSNVPSDAYFVVGSTPVGAAIGETGLWVFSASDLFAGNTWAQGPPESGGLKMVGLLVNVPSSGAIMSASAFVVDALGGTSASQPVASEMLGGINLASENMSDPLVFSWTGEDVAAIRLDTSDPTGADPDDRIYIDFDKDGKSDLASAWLTQPDAEKYSFLVRSGDGAPVVGQTITLDNLFETFSDLSLALGLTDPLVIGPDDFKDNSGSQLVQLWTDSDVDGVVDAGELEELPDNFTLTLPETQYVGNVDAAGIQTFYQASVSYGVDVNADGSPDQSGTLFAIGIPYLEVQASGQNLANTTESFFNTNPAVAVSFVSERSTTDEIPEDAPGGPQFWLSLTKATSSVTDTPTHLVVLEIEVTDSSANILNDWELSAGAYKDGKWILSESSLGQPIRVTGLPENFAGAVSVTAKAYATAADIQNGGVPQVVDSGDGTQSSLQVYGVADTPILSMPDFDGWAPEEGGTLYLTANGAQGGLAVVSAFSTDADEDLFVQFSIRDTDAEAQPVTSGLMVVGASDLGGGVYEVAASALGEVAVTLADNYKTDFEITFTAISQQEKYKGIEGGDVTDAQSADTLTFSAAVQHRADALDADITKFALSTASVDEGETNADLLAQVTLSTTLADASELIVHQVLVGSRQTGFSADSILGLSGYTELAPTLLDAGYWSGVLDVDVANFESTNWKLFQLESAENEDGVFSTSGKLALDAFYDGTLTVAQSAYTVELQNGDASVAQTNVQTLTVNPLVDSASTNIYFADSSGNAINSVVLTEGDTEGDTAGATFRIYASSSDSDEVLVLPDTLELPAGFSLTSDVGDQGVGYKTYRVVANEGVSIVAGQTPSVGASVKLTDDSPSTTISRTLNIALTKIATTPTFVADEVTDLAISVIDGQRYATHGDSASGLGVYFELPTIPEASRSDDTLTYRLEMIPKWMTLVSPVGSLVSSTETHYTLAFSEADPQSLRWKFNRDFLLSETDPDATATLKWIAVHTEASNFDTMESEPIDITVTRTPYPSVPVIVGPKEISGVEGDAISLSGYSVNLGAFEALLTKEQKAASVTVGVAVEGRDLKRTSKDGEPLVLEVGDLTESSGAVTNIAYEDLALATVVFKDPDLVTTASSGPLSFTLSAEFTLDTNYRTSDLNAGLVEVTIQNLPEPLNPSVVDWSDVDRSDVLPPDLREDANTLSLGSEERKGVLIKIVGESHLDDGVESLDYKLGAPLGEGEEVVVTLVLNGGVELWLVDDAGTGGQVIVPLSSDAD